MRIAVLSDIHSNLPALEAVLEDAFKRGAESFWCLGDMVGYYSDPVEPLMFVKNHVNSDDWVMGNHDAMLADLILPQDADLNPHGVDVQSKAGPIFVRGRFLSLEDWRMVNKTPIFALELNRRELDAHPESTEFWRSQFSRQRIAPRRVFLDGREYIRVHASLYDHLGKYVFPWHHEIHLPDEFRALDELKQDSTAPQTLFCGHTHVPALIYGKKSERGLKIESVFFKPFRSYPLDEHWALINPGSVGQPRDGDRRASYALLDTGANQITFIRVEYPYKETAYRLLRRGYPESLASKLREAPPVREMPEVWKNHYAQKGGV